VTTVTSAPAPAAVRPGVVSGRGDEVVQWLAPAPLWDEDAVSAGSANIAQPWISELTSDQFVDQFLAMVQATDDSTPDQLAGTAPQISVAGQSGTPYRLFHPLSQRYYIVSASLVCRRPGIPDHQVRPRAGEKTTYVMRQLADDGSELAYVPVKGAALTPGAPATGNWVAATTPTALVTGEKQYPMHAAPVASFAATGSTAAILGMANGETSTRTIYFGYVSVGGREKLIAPIADPVATLKAFGEQPGNPAEDPFVDELVGRVAQPWVAQSKAPLNSKAPTYPSLYLLLDLLDWTKKYLPKLYAALIAGSGPSSTDLPEQAALFDQLQDVTITKNGVAMTLDKALAEVEQYLPLVTSNDIEGPGDVYDLTHSSRSSPDLDTWLDPTSSNGLAAQAQSALNESAADPDDPPLGVPPELQGLIKNDPVTPPPGSVAQTLVIRTVFEHDPCCPVLSPPSHPFVLARPVDADAPARKIRIQLPDVASLRSFNRGVALEMPPSLRRVMNAVTPDALKGDIDPSGGLQLGMICSFSLQIIFLCAFIVLFIFLLLLNIVFWWMPFLKICFPIPVKPSSPKGPTP
jgi:hypothetical protein